jgi:hypothetical protein
MHKSGGWTDTLTDGGSAIKIEALLKNTYRKEETK